MAAGDRAAEQSRLAAERVARLRRELERAERNAHSWSVGAAGEALVAEAMTELEPLGWLSLHDVHWPGRPKANIDHILVGPGGVLIVDAKNWSGDVRLRDGVLRQNGYSREQEASGVLRQSAALAALLEPGHRRLVQGWICLVGQPEFHGATSTGVRVEGLNSLRSAVAGLPAVLDPALVPAVHMYLRELLGGSTSPQLLTTAQLEPNNAPAASLQQWRARATPPAREAPSRSRKPRGRSKRLSCWGVLLRMALLLVGISMLLNFAFHYRQSVPPAPRPSPTLTQTVPAR